MKTKLFALLPVVCAMLFTACKDEKKDLGPDELTLSATELNFSAEAQSQTLTIKSTFDWGLQGYEDDVKAWLSIDPETGSASAEEVTVTFTVLANADNNRSATITFYGNVMYKQSVTITQLGDKGDGEAITVAQFIEKADTQNPYVLQGTISNINSSYKYFDLSDGTASVQIYQPDNFADFPLENGGTARVKGVYKLFQKTDGTTVHEMEKGTILSYTGPDLGDHIFAQTFSSSLGGFEEVVKSGSIPSGVWGHDAQYKCAKATAYINSTNNASEAWLVSPEIDLTAQTAATLTYDHAGKYFNALASEISLMVSKNGGDFVQLVIPAYPANDFKFVSSGKISLKDFLGAKVRIALVYTSTATKAGTYEVQNFFVDAEDSGETVYPTVVQCGTVADIIAVAKDTKFNCTEPLLVTAKTTGGVIVSDATGNVYVYDAEATANLQIGNKITFAGTRDTYNGLAELVGISDLKVASSGNPVNYPEATDITAGFDAYTSTTATYICFTGTLSTSKSGSTTYYNMAVPGATMLGSISLPLESLGLDAMEGKLITVTGYYNGPNSSKYQNIIAVSVAESGAPFLSVDKTAISVAATDQTASFNVGGNASWTVSCDDEALVADPTSGSGAAEVVLTFPENTDTENAKVYNVKVSTEEEAPVKEFTVVITQKKASSGGGDAVTVSVDFTQMIAELPQGSSAGVKDGTYMLGGYEFIIHAADKAYQAKSGEKYYLLIGKANSYLQLPVIAGKALVGVQFLTGSAASENVVVDVAKVDGEGASVPLNVNTDNLKKGTEYEWEVPGDADQAYRLLITNKYNAQFQNLVLTYE